MTVECQINIKPIKYRIIKDLYNYSNYILRFNNLCKLKIYYISFKILFYYCHLINRCINH